MSSWSAKAGPHPAGDPDLHHYVGELLYKGAHATNLTLNVPNLIRNWRRISEGTLDAAEPHFLSAGKRDSARLLAEMFVEWAGPDGPAGAFALRGTIP